MILLASIGSASAECAWVLWADFRSEREGEPRWYVLRAFPKKAECEEEIKSFGGQSFGGPISRLLCLPDTIDACGPKGK